MRMGFGFGLCKGNGGPSPAFDSNFLSGALPPGLTYTNSSTTRTYFGADGLLKTAAANEPIFEYDPVTRALLGMRWEMEQRTNLALYSTLPGGGAAPTGWTQTIATGTSAPAASIYGNADGSVAYAQAATAQRPFISQTFAASANTTYTVSALIESRTGTLLASDVLTLSTVPTGATVTFPVCQANPSGGAGTLGTGVLEVRVAVAGTAGNVIARVGLGGAGAVTGTLQFSRPQFEAGASRSSFIPTAAAAVTRQPDVLSATSISPWYRQDEGTVLFEGISQIPAASSTAHGIFLFSDGSDNNRVTGRIGTAGAVNTTVVNAASVQATAQTANSYTANSVFRSTHCYKLNSVAVSLNGGAVVEDASVTIPTITGLKLGQGNTAGTQAFMGYARRFQYFPKRLPDAQIQGMSRV